VIDLKLVNVDDQQVTIQLYNSIGQLMQQEKTMSLDGRVDEEIRLLAGAPAGLYMVRVIAGDEVYTEQLVIQR
jgi:hypothetical protein